MRLSRLTSSSRNPSSSFGRARQALSAPRRPWAREQSQCERRESMTACAVRSRLCRLRHNRHTFASRLAMKGVDLYRVQILMGHKTPAMTLRYAHLSPDHLVPPSQRWTLQNRSGGVRSLVEARRNGELVGDGFSHGCEPNWEHLGTFRTEETFGFSCMDMLADAR